MSRFAFHGALTRLDPPALLAAARRLAWGDRRLAALAGHLADAMPQRGTVLHVDCGDGKVARALMALRPDLVVTGADSAPHPAAGIDVVRSSEGRLPLRDGAVDYVLVVDHGAGTADPALVLAEAARVCRRGVVLKGRVCDVRFARPRLVLADWLAGRPPARRHMASAEWEAVFHRSWLTPVSKVNDLNLSPPPIHWIFDRNLHFVVLLSPGLHVS